MRFQAVPEPTALLLTLLALAAVPRRLKQRPFTRLPVITSRTLVSRARRHLLQYLLN